MSDPAQTIPAIAADRVAKTFRLPRERVHTLKERVLHPLRSTATDDLRALRDVSFAVEPGEFFGIVGRNGSGKSTLLKCIAGIYKADAGEIYVNGRLSTFIELGVGFNTDLPARDNILINATMLGLTPREARRRVDSVIEFAELEDFTDLKLKNYSSGMMVRLAFSVMIQVDADILLIDEVLAVGDASFQQKCFEEFERIRREGRTVILVTHDMGAVRRFCDRAMLLEQGHVVTIGAPDDVGRRYLQLNFSEAARAAEEQESDGKPKAPAKTNSSQAGGEALGDGGAHIVEAWFEGPDGTPSPTLTSGEACAFAMRVRFDEDVEDPIFAMSMTNSQGLQLFSASTVFTDPHPGLYRAGEEVVYRVELLNSLGSDRYAVSAAVTTVDGRWLQFRESMFSVMVTTTKPTGSLVDLPYEASVSRESQGAKEAAQ
jgi:ABC-type polysaccharide/polyol phosphate transport system ATPase subunit